MDQSTKKSMMKAAIIHLEREKSSSIFFLTKGMSKSSQKLFARISEPSGLVYRSGY